MYELLIAHKETGDVWDVSGCVPGEVELSTQRSGSPASISFTCVYKGIEISHGDIVRFSVDGKLIFYGYVFTLQFDRWGLCTVKAYDRLRYLKTNATYAFYAITAGDIIRQIAEDLQLDVGYIEDTGYKIPSLIESDKSCIDIIQDAIGQTLLNTGIVYVFYDDGDGLSLRQAGGWVSDEIVGEKSLATDVNYQTDIDTNVYNSVKLVQPNESTGRRDVVQAIDSANIGRWGLLQLYQTVDSGLNQAQIAEMARRTLKYYNKVRRTLAISALGINGLRAGMMVRVYLPSIGGESILAWVLLESVTHVYSSDLHTMEIETLELTDDLIGRAAEDQ